MVKGVLEEAGIRLLWFDSLGVKSSSFIVESDVGKIIVDPGAAAMQPSYPLPSSKKRKLRKKALTEISKELAESIAAVITHYHYDHHFLPSDKDAHSTDAWLNKLIIAKNPNMYINESQWGRSRKFLSEIARLCGSSLEEFVEEPRKKAFEDPVEKLEYALSKDFGNYSSRRRELLAKGKEWFLKISNKLWAKKPWIKEFEIGKCVKVVWAENRTFKFGNVEIRTLNPWFHGLEYDRTGWIVPLIIESNGYKIFYTSDVMGPEIEDYAYFIAEEKPDIVILDGPPVYLFPYMLNRINLERAVMNAIRIIEAKPELIIYDHHLLRSRLWRKYVKQVFQKAESENVKLLTAAEYLGLKPLIDTLR